MGIALKFGSLWGIVLGRAIAGTTAGSLPIAQAAMMDISEDHEKPARLGLVVLGNVSGFVLGPAIGALFMDQAIWGAANYQAPFYAGGCIALLGLLLLLICFKETSQNLTDHAIHPLTGFVNIIKVFAAEKTGLLFVVFSLFMFAWGMFFSLIPVVLTERFLWDGSAVGYYITYIAFIFGMAVMVILPRLSKRFSIHKIVSISLLCLMVAAILYPLIHQIIWLWLLILIISAVPFAYVGVVTILSMQTEASKQGMLMGVVGSVFALAWGVAGPILNGYLLRYGLDVPFIAIAIMFAMAALLFVSASSMHKN
jgi:predicted MFS family arabinose efflux permease